MINTIVLTMKGDKEPSKEKRQSHRQQIKAISERIDQKQREMMAKLERLDQLAKARGC